MLAIWLDDEFGPRGSCGLVGGGALPDLVDKNKELGELLKEVHKLLNFTLLALFSMHVGAALKHHFVERDGVLARMLPFLNKGAFK